MDITADFERHLPDMSGACDNAHTPLPTKKPRHQDTKTPPSHRHTNTERHTFMVPLRTLWKPLISNLGGKMRSYGVLVSNASPEGTRTAECKQAEQLDPTNKWQIASWCAAHTCIAFPKASLQAWTNTSVVRIAVNWNSLWIPKIVVSAALAARGGGWSRIV